MDMPGFVSPMSGETPVAVTHPSWWNYFGTVVVGVLLIAAFGLGLLVLLWVHVCVKTTCAVATSKRVIVKSGWLNTRQTEVRIEDIRGVNLSRTIWQRIFGIGDIAIGTAATEGAEIVMKGVTDPEAFVAAVNAQRR